MVHISGVGSQRTHRKPSQFRENMQTAYRKDSMGSRESNPQPSSYEVMMLIPHHPQQGTTVPMEHLDVSSFKLVWVAAVNDDDPLNQGAKATRESCHHLGNTRHFLTPLLFQLHLFVKPETCRHRGGRGLQCPRWCTWGPGVFHRLWAGRRAGRPLRWCQANSTKETTAPHSRS